MFLCALGGTPTLLLNSVDNELEEVRHRIRKAKVELVEVKQDLAAAKEAKNVEREKSPFDMLLSLNNQLLSLNNQLLSLQEKENILLRSQAASKPCLYSLYSSYMLAHIMLRSIQWKPVWVCIKCVSMNDIVLWVLLLNMTHKGCLPRLTYVHRLHILLYLLKVLRHAFSGCDLYITWLSQSSLLSALSCCCFYYVSP